MQLSTEFQRQTNTSSFHCKITLHIFCLSVCYRNMFHPSAYYTIKVTHSFVSKNSFDIKWFIFLPTSIFIPGLGYIKFSTKLVIPRRIRRRPQKKYINVFLRNWLKFWTFPFLNKKLLIFRNCRYRISSDKTKVLVWKLFFTTKNLTQIFAQGNGEIFE